jgi:hypothetical protein
MRPFRKCLKLRENRRLQIFGHFSFVQNLHKIVLNIPVLACESLPFASQKLTFYTPKGYLSHSKSIPFAKPKVKSGDFAPRFLRFHL